jgi:hypothetical protein
VNVVHEIGCLARPAYRWRTALYFALAGPAAFALFFCANGIIAICFDGVRGDRPVSEFVTMLMVFPILSFLFAYVAVLPAFLGLGLWLLAANALRRNIYAATLVFVPVMIYVSCRSWGSWMPLEDMPVPDLVFGAAMIWAFPLKGFLLIFLGNFFAVGCCCWVLNRRSKPGRA